LPEDSFLSRGLPGLVRPYLVLTGGAALVPMIEIDGSMGEGGGQIVRTALSLALLRRQPFRMTNIRAGRDPSGLRPQHKTAVEAAANIGSAQVSGTTVGSTTLSFVPEDLHPGTYHFDVGTAGSAVLVLQTVLPPLLTAPRSSRVTVVGGTHVRSAPPFEYLTETVLPLVERMGAVCRAQMDRPGFYPKGGGQCSVDVTPVPQLDPLHLLDRGAEQRRRARVLLANLPRHIADRELKTLREHLPGGMDEERIDTPSALGAGNAVLIELHFEHVTEVVSVIGEKGRPAESVAQEAAQMAREYLEVDAPVGSHLADQLLLPLVQGGGQFRTSTLTPHVHTNAAVIGQFMDDRLSIRKDNGSWVVAASP